MSTVAFLGLGHMGGPMAANLLSAGYTVHGFDPVPTLKDAAAQQGTATERLQAVYRTLLEESLRMFFDDRKIYVRL